jgi:hypothetical protein
VRGDLLGQIDQYARQLSNVTEQSKDNANKQFERLGLFLAQRSKNDAKKLPLTADQPGGASIFALQSSIQKPQQIQDQEAGVEDQRANFEQQTRQGQAPTHQGSPDAQSNEKTQLFQLLQSYIKDNKNADVQGIKQLLMQSNAGLQEGEDAQKKIQGQDPVQLAALPGGELAQDQKSQQ